MSRFLILGLFILVSCAGDQQPESNSLGKEIEYNPVEVSQEDDDRLKLICSALNSKANILRARTSPDYNYTFSYSEKGCKNNEFGNTDEIRTKIVPAGSGFMFKMENTDPFYFSDVETADVGLMSEICKSTGRLMNPIQTVGPEVLMYSLGMDTSMCESDGNSVCVYFQKGTFINAKKFKIHTQEWVKFKLMDPYKGFFSERTLKSVADCSEKEYFMKKAVLK